MVPWKLLLEGTELYVCFALQVALEEFQSMQLLRRGLEKFYRIVLSETLKKRNNTLEIAECQTLNW